MNKKVRILMIEDETDILCINKKYLLEEGYEVHCAESLLEGRNILWEFPPDLILLDVMLPDGSGFDFCKEIRKYTSVPIIFLTAMGEEQNIVGGLTSGGDDYVTKPYSPAILLARITAQLRRHGIHTGVIELPPLYIDVAAGKVILNDEKLELTRKEFHLLVYLAERRGQELSPQQIYRDVWGGTSDTMGSTVRVNISRLRQKLCLSENSCFELSTTTEQNYLFLRVRYPAEG